MNDKFTRSELEMVYQYAAPTKEETLAGLKEIVPVIRDAQTKAVVQNTIKRLEQIPEPDYRRHQSPLSGRTGQIYPPPDSRSQSADSQSKADAQERNRPEKSGA